MREGDDLYGTPVIVANGCATRPTRERSWRRRWSCGSPVPGWTRRGSPSDRCGEGARGARVRRAHPLARGRRRRRAPTRSPRGPITAVVVDDERLLRVGFRVILEAEPDITVVGEAADGRAALDVRAPPQARRRADGHPHARARRARGGGAAARRSRGAERRDHAPTFDRDQYVYEALRIGARASSSRTPRPTACSTPCAWPRPARRCSPRRSPAADRTLRGRPADGARRGARADGGPDRARARRPADDRPRPVERGDRGRAGPRREHRQDPRRPRARQARRAGPRAGGRARLRGGAGPSGRGERAGPLRIAQGVRQQGRQHEPRHGRDRRDPAGRAPGLARPQAPGGEQQRDAADEAPPRTRSAICAPPSGRDGQSPYSPMLQARSRMNHAASAVPSTHRTPRAASAVAPGHARAAEAPREVRQAARWAPAYAAAASVIQSSIPPRRRPASAPRLSTPPGSRRARCGCTARESAGHERAAPDVRDQPQAVEAVMGEDDDVGLGRVVEQGELRRPGCEECRTPAMRAAARGVALGDPLERGGAPLGREAGALRIEEHAVPRPMPSARRRTFSRSTASPVPRRTK